MFEYAKELSSILTANKFESYIVGGAVRDFLLDLKVHDVDITTNAKPWVVTKIFDEAGYKVIPIGEKFGTVQILSSKTGEIIEITTYRSETGYSDYRHPDEITFETDLLKDLSRRDFTINAVAFDPITEKYVDPYNGRDHLTYRKIVTVGNPEDRFNEDPLRMMRMCRFSASLDFYVDENARKEAKKLSHLITSISPERVRDELIKILESDNPNLGIGAMLRTGLLHHILPELESLQGVKQPSQHHSYDVFFHSCGTMMELTGKDPYLMLAGLLHDIGKRKMNDEAPYFPDHASDSERILIPILERLKISKEKQEYVRFLVRDHMDGFMLCKNYTQTSLRKYLSKIKEPSMLFGLRSLILADIRASGYVKNRELSEINELFAEMFKILLEKPPFSRKDLAINGHDLLKLGIPATPILGKILKEFLDEVLEFPERNTRTYLIKSAKTKKGKCKKQKVEITKI